MSRSIEALVYAAMDRYMHGGTGGVGNNRFHERHGMVTSYDPDKYLAKVRLWPEGYETGWLPIETGHTGNDYGIAIGLQPGDGKSTGDQVIIRFQEGDLESGKIVQRVHSDDEKPPKVESGEVVIWAKFRKSQDKSTLGDDSAAEGAGGDNDEAQSGQGGSGQQIYLKNDGSVTLTDGNGGTLAFDGKGNGTLICNNLTFKINGNWISDIAKVMTAVAGSDIGFGAGNNFQAAAGNFAGMEGGSLVNLQGGGSVSDGSVSPSGGGQVLPPTSVTP